MTRASILQGEHPSLGKLFAAVDPSTRYVTPKAQELRFAALLTSFPDRASATLALETAGATNIAEVSR